MGDGGGVGEGAEAKRGRGEGDENNVIPSRSYPTAGVRLSRGGIGTVKAGDRLSFRLRFPFRALLDISFSLDVSLSHH